MEFTKKNLFYTAALLAVAGGIAEAVQIKKMKRQISDMTTLVNNRVLEAEQNFTGILKSIDLVRETEHHLSDTVNTILEIVDILLEIEELKQKRYRQFWDTIDKNLEAERDNIEKDLDDLILENEEDLNELILENLDFLKKETESPKKEEQPQKGTIKELRKKEVKSDETNEELKKKWANMPPQEAKSKIKRLIYQLGENPANAFSDEKIVEIMSTRHGVEPWITEFILKERDRAEKYYETLTLKLDWDNLSENDKERLAEIISYVSIDHDGFMSTEHIKRDFKKRFNGKPSVILEAKALADKKRDELYKKGELVFPPKRG